MSISKGAFAAAFVLLAALLALAGSEATYAQASAPSVTGVEVTSDAGDDDTYALGETITITVTFSEAVDVTGTPQLKIDMDPADWGTKVVDYEGGSGTASLSFDHEVVEPNYSTQGIAVLEDSLALNGGTIRSASSQTDAALSHARRDHDPEHKVNWQLSAAAPWVTGVAVSSAPASGDTYVLGETITITVTFSEAVDVTGTPQLKIDMDPAHWGTKVVDYKSGSGTSSLTFDHEVAQPNYSTQGIAVLADSLALNGGTIRSASSQTDAGLSHTGRDHDPEHKVNWQLAPPDPTPTPTPTPSPTPTPAPTPSPTPTPAPTPSPTPAPAPSVTGVEVTSDAGDDDTYALGETITVTVTFSEAVDVTGTPRLKIDMDPASWGEKWAGYASGSGTDSLAFAHTVVEPNYSTQGIAVLENSLELNGGTIRSASSQADAALSHAGRDHDAGHKVDWQLEPAEPACALTAPSSVSGVGIAKAAVISWTLPEDNADTCRVTGFTVGATNDNGLSFEAPVIDPEARRYVLRGLDPGEYRFFVRIEYAEGPSDDLVTLKQNTVPATCDITLTVEPYSGSAISGSWTSVAGRPTGCVHGPEIEFHLKRSQDDYYKAYGRFPNKSQPDPDLPDFIFYGLEPYVGHDFKVVAVDAAGEKHASNAASATLVSNDPSATADANSPGNVRVHADNNSGALVTWGEYTAPAGRTVSSIVVEWKTGAGAAMTAEVPHSTDGNSNFVQRRYRITGLTDGQAYTVRAAARTYQTGDASMTTSDAWSVPTPPVWAWSEPTQFWFISNTPNHNPTVGRTFMRTNSNKSWASSACSVSSTGGSDGTINCPVGNLVSLTAKGDITVDGTLTVNGETTSASTTEGTEGGPTGFLARASGGAAASDGNAATNEGRIVIAWDAAGTGNVIGSLDAYIVQHRKQNADGTWPGWPAGEVKAETDRSHTFTGLADGTWQVRVRGRAANTEGMPEQTVHRLGFTSEILTVTVDAEDTGTVRPRAVHVAPGASQSLIAEWELPTRGSIPYAYQVRHRLASATGDGGWTESEVLHPRLTRRMCGPTGCVNPRRYEITGLTAGVEYDVDVRARNANGWGEWTGAYGHNVPND